MRKNVILQMVQLFGMTRCKVVALSRIQMQSRTIYPLLLHEGQGQLQQQLQQHSKNCKSCLHFSKSSSRKG